MNHLASIKSHISAVCGYSHFHCICDIMPNYLRSSLHVSQIFIDFKLPVLEDRCVRSNRFSLRIFNMASEETQCVWLHNSLSYVAPQMSLLIVGFVYQVDYKSIPCQYQIRTLIDQLFVLRFQCVATTGTPIHVVIRSLYLNCTFHSTKRRMYTLSSIFVSVTRATFYASHSRLILHSMPVTCPD